MAVPGKSSNSELRSFGLVLGAAFALIFGALPLLRAHRLVAWPFALAAVLWVVALFAPGSLSGVHALWTRLGRALGWLNMRIILSIMFFVWVVPAALVMRLLGRDKLGVRLGPSVESYRVAARKRPPESMERPY